MKGYILLLLYLTIPFQIISQNISIVIGDTTNTTYHRLLIPFDTIRQKIPGYPDSCFLDLNHDGRIDFLLLSKGNLEGMMGGAYEYFTITPYDSNAVVYGRNDTATCFENIIRPVIKSFSLHDTLIDQDKYSYQSTFINFSEWILGSPCGSIYLGDFTEEYVGLKINSAMAWGLGWIKVETMNGQFSYGPVGILKEFAFKSGIIDIQPIDKPRLHIFPNPSTGLISIVLPNASFSGNYSVYNTSGARVSKGEIRTGSVVLNLQKGLYLIKIELPDNEVVEEKIIIK